MLLQWDEEQRKEVKERVLIHADVSTDNPLIIIATANMIVWARRFGHDRPVSIDTTFGITRYGYSLCTLIALNDRGRGVPICVAIMKRERDVDFANVLQVLVDKMGNDWRPSVFLADAAKSEHNGIRYTSLFSDFAFVLCPCVLVSVYGMLWRVTSYQAKLMHIWLLGRVEATCGISNCYDQHNHLLAAAWQPSQKKQL
jgi:hypothetical protein